MIAGVMWGVVNAASLVQPQRPLPQEHREAIRAYAAQLDPRTWQRRADAARTRLDDELDPVREALGSLRSGLLDAGELRVAASLSAVSEALTWLGNGFDSWNCSMTASLLASLDLQARNEGDAQLAAAMAGLVDADVSSGDLDRLEGVIGRYRRRLSAHTAEGPPFGGFNYAPRIIGALIESAGTYIRLLGDFIGSGADDRAQGCGSTDVDRLVLLFRDLQREVAIQVMTLDTYCRDKDNLEERDSGNCAKQAVWEGIALRIRSHIAWLNSVPASRRLGNVEAQRMSEEICSSIRTLTGRH